MITLADLRAASALVAVAAVTACGHAPVVETTAAPPKASAVDPGLKVKVPKKQKKHLSSVTKPISQTGVASWYGKRFHGRQTASGERYDRFALTAAHRKLPFGTQIKVTNARTGKSVTLTVNDRGPFKGKRILDVSEKAAELLGFRNAGLARVRIEVLERS